MKNTNEESAQVADSAIAVHKELGSGLLESAYEACLAHELVSRGLRVERQKAVPLLYRGLHVECGCHLDLPVEDVVIAELKSVEKLEKIHQAQLLAYLKLSGWKTGLLINFNVQYPKDGIRRFVI